MRYEAIEIDGEWFVFDHWHPDRQPAKCENKEDAVINARVWNLVSS